MKIAIITLIITSFTSISSQAALWSTRGRAVAASCFVFKDNDMVAGAREKLTQDPSAVSSGPACVNAAKAYVSSIPGTHCGDKFHALLRDSDDNGYADQNINPNWGEQFSPNCGSGGGSHVDPVCTNPKSTDAQRRAHHCPL